MSIIGDNPIKTASDDALGRASIAETFASQITALDASEGVVVGVLGEWGSGKTSFINLARADLEAAGVEVLDFNPWMFSGAEQLVESFFVEIAAQLRMRPGLADIGGSLLDYGEAFAGLAWVPVVGPWIERGRATSRLLGRLLQRRREGSSGRRERLTRALAKLTSPVVIVLDDIDRLSTSEIRDVFKLVRLTASFPNLIYVLAFDRRRVEDALAEQGIPGRDYLEKILQIAVDLPAVPERALTTQILTAIGAAIEGLDNPGEFDKNAWPDVFMEVIRPLVRNMRDVRRYAASIHGTVRALQGQVALVDVLGMEAIRVFSPDTFLQISRTVESLTTPSQRHFGGGREPDDLRQGVDRLLEVGREHEAAVRAMISRLFPAAQRHIGGSHFGPDWQRDWLRRRRVAHEEILRLYLERVAGERLQAFIDAERAWALITDESALDHYLRSLDADRLQDVISSLEAYEDDFGAEHLVSGATVLVNLLPELPERRLGVFDIDTSTIVGRVVYRLLRAAGDQDAVGAGVCAIVPKLNSLYGRREIIADVGYRENAGHRLVTETTAAELDRAWRREVRDATADELSREKDLLRTLYFARREAEPEEAPLVVPDDPAVTRALLRSARTETRSQTVGTRVVRREPRLVWDLLIDVFGDEETLRLRIERLAASRHDGDEELLALAKRYLDGWRPRDLG